ncbi:Alkanesulfonate monooxygenase [Wickerhamomyces ciferrii]|uniref:Alkanesulfonate monooxygenase n=1 Tax=Wickerhamomyces ciferrii (strain ATCC 14091 / BCRC 22168 / CBS 111 / JCM 3599 / NBRC 0793 / NRRL Y-1031 F-60-10) TaxID=1206466 RepID=K0KP22_WICCF|nr:Alkanesulfonate monooxygenase [Wickerhamomyces ciferrii]CCH43937.1 Alkanesulfonate monooxygenase [Wickerhamomyces ciferrii]
MTEPQSKKLKKTKRTEPLILNFFQALTPVLHAPGQWRNPRDQSRDYTKPEYWIKIAQLAEKGKLHGIFFGDSLAIYGGYKSQGLGGAYNYEEAAKSGNNFPKNDPTAYISALAITTKNVSFGITCSTLTEHPYHFARRYSTLDHITGGRMGWNVVTSFLPSAGRQLSPDNKLPEKDLRYEKADEYLQVFYELLLSSWRDDGVVFDRENGVFSDPEAIREINFDGKFFKVPGPQISEPSPQRIPLIIQAGSSPKGQRLGAKHGELIFLGSPTPEETKKKIEFTKKLAKEEFGRNPDNLKFVTIASAVLGRTHEEAVTKYKELDLYKDAEGIYTQLGGGGFDFSKFDDDEDLSKVDDPSIKGFAASYATKYPGEIITKKFIVDNYHTGAFVGTPQEVADQIEDYVERSGVDGFNFTNIVFPENFEDLVELLIPELQERGLAQKEYAVDGGTYREQVYRQKGHTFVPEDHYAYDLRWKAGVSKEEFEEHVAKVKKEQEKYAI